MGKITRLEDLEVYKEALRLTGFVYKLCKSTYLIKEYSLCDQLKRASISVCANIAEGFGRRTKADFANFLSIALGSTNEMIALLDVLALNFPRLKVVDLRNDYVILSKRIFTFRRKVLS